MASCSPFRLTSSRVTGAEFDLDRLETHLRICPACAAWAAQVRDVTQQLREAPLEVPAEPFVLPRAGRRRAVSASVALASAAAVVATMFISAGQHQSSALLHGRFLRPF